MKVEDVLGQLGLDMDSLRGGDVDVRCPTDGSLAGPGGQR